MDNHYLQSDFYCFTIEIRFAPSLLLLWKNKSQLHQFSLLEQ